MGHTQSLPIIGQPREPLHPLQLLHQRYQVKALLAQDGFGAVYVAHDIRLDLPVALKISLCLEDEFEEVEMLRNEARCLAQLHHPGIPGYFDFFEASPGQWVLAMQLIQGGRIMTQHPLPARQVAFVGQALCEILAYLHQQNSPIVHRDIKPTNILRDESRIFLIDFGLSCHPGNDDWLVGSPGFAAPEAVMGGFISPKTDVYGLGQTLRFLLMGYQPSHLSSETWAPSSVPSNVFASPMSSPLSDHEQLLALCACMTDSVPENRPEIAVIERELQAVLAR